MFYEGKLEVGSDAEAILPFSSLAHINYTGNKRERILFVRKQGIVGVLFIKTNECNPTR